MPSIDQGAKRWQNDFAGRVGEAIRDRRKSLRLTAQDLSAKTVDAGYPITRVAISKIESNSRSGKLDVAELVVLAFVLDIPPALLLFPDYPIGSVEVLPGLVAGNETAVDWLAGRVVLQPTDEGNAGTSLVRSVLSRNDLEDQLTVVDLDRDITEASGRDPAVHDRIVARLTGRINDTSTAIEAVRARLWGSSRDA